MTLPASHQDFKDAGTPSTSLSSSQAQHTRYTILLSHSNLSYPNTLTYKDVLNLRIWSPNIWVGLEVFLNMCGTSLNSSNTKMAGVRRLYRPPSRTSRFEPLLLFLRRRRIIRRGSEKGVRSSDPIGIFTVAVEFQTNCWRHLSDALVRPSFDHASDHPVQ